MHSCLPPPPLPPNKCCITIVFDFTWDDCNTQEKLKTTVMQNFGGLIGCIIVYVSIANCEFNFWALNFSCSSGTASFSCTLFFAKWRARNASNTRVTGVARKGTMRRRKTRGPISTPRLPLRPKFYRGRYVWVRGWLGDFFGLNLLTRFLVA